MTTPICEQCEREPATGRAEVKWYKGCSVGSHVYKEAALCRDCMIVALCSGDFIRSVNAENEEREI